MSRRNFVYKRSPHQAIAARFVPTYSYPGQTSDTNAPPPATTSPAAKPDPVTPTPPPPPAPKTSTTSSTTSTSSTPTTTSTTSTSSSTSSSSSSSALSTPPPVVPIATPPPFSTQVVTTPTGFLPTTTSTPSATSTPASSSGPSTTAIVGGVAGALVGIAVLGFIVMWCLRRQRDRDDDFDATAFRRQSAILVDDPVEPPQAYNPRPPTMIERHNASPALAAQSGYGGQNFYGNYGGYGQQPPYAPPEMISHAASPPPHAYGGPAAMGYAYNEPPQALAREPSNATYLTREPSSAASYSMLSPVDPHYVDLNRASVTPFQAAQYADIATRLGTPDPNAHVAQFKEPATLPEEPLPSPFDEPAEVTPPPAAVVAPVKESAASTLQPRANATAHVERPTSAYTVYDEGDAYGGI